MVVLISTVIAMGVGVLLASIILGVAKFLMRYDRRGGAPRIDDPDAR